MKKDFSVTAELRKQLKNEDLATALEIKEFLEKNYRDRFDYEFLCHKFHINQFKLKRAFKEVTNDNIHFYLTKIRIEHAKILLETTDRTIRDIACKVGLDKSNLNIQFKKHTGKTLSEWRKNAIVDAKFSPHPVAKIEGN